MFRSSFAEGIGDKGFAPEGFAGESVGSVIGFITGGDRVRERGVEFAGGDLFCCGLGVAELAMREVAVLGTAWWPERPTEHGAMLVEIAGAGAGAGVEDGAGLVVREVLEGLVRFVVFAEDAGTGVAGECGREAGKRVGHAGSEAVGSGEVGLG